MAKKPSPIRIKLNHHADSLISKLAKQSDAGSGTKEPNLDHIVAMVMSLGPIINKINTVNCRVGPESGIESGASRVYNEVLCMAHYVPNVGDKVIIAKKGYDYYVVGAVGPPSTGSFIIPLYFPGFQVYNEDPTAYPMVVIRLAEGEHKTLVQADFYAVGPGPGGRMTVRHNGNNIAGLTDVLARGHSTVNVTPDDPVKLLNGDTLDMVVTETCYSDWVAGTLSLEVSFG